MSRVYFFLLQNLRIFIILLTDLTIMKLRICIGIHVHMFQSNFVSDCGVSDFIYHKNMSTESF